MSPAADPGWFETVDSRHVYRGFSDVRVDTLRTRDGTEVEREVVERPEAVGIVALDTSDRVLLLRQYRHAVGDYLIEIPAGLMDVEGESPETAARRELAEELAHDAPQLSALTSFVNSAGWCTERTHLFLACGCTPGASPEGFVADAEEADMEVVAMSVADALDAVRNGVITDAKTVIGLLLAEQHLPDA